VLDLERGLTLDDVVLQVLERPLVRGLRDAQRGRADERARDLERGERA
jgi:hypothetical protein